MRTYILVNGELKKIDENSLLSNIKEYHWIYESKNEKIYGLARVENNYIYFKIRISYAEEPRIKIIIADSYDELVRTSMSNHLYKKYIKDTN